jgi:hypothetical protein
MRSWASHLCHGNPRPSSMERVVVFLSACRLACFFHRIDAMLLLLSTSVSAAAPSSIDHGAQGVKRYH